MGMAEGLRSVFSVWLIVLYLGMLGLHECYEPSVPGIFIFGDSTVDVGTNHYLAGCRARADFAHNGIDFPHSIATGRFSNGFNVVDYIAILLGFTMSPPPFLSLLDKNKQLPKEMIRYLIRGVNFASGGSGLQNDTGRRKWGRVVCFAEQVEQFAAVRNKISESLGEECAAANISKSLFLISVGSNDIFEHFAYNNQSGQDYITTLMSTYESRLRHLFDIGAKKFGIISVAPIGCVPLMHNFTQSEACFEPMNDHARLFYKALQDLLLKLSSEYKGMMYALADAYNMTTPILTDPHKYGFNEVTKACCGKGNFNAEKPCTPKADVCKYRNASLFWDQFHPTQAASNLAALAVFGNPEFVEPMTFGQLALLP